jgi:hypothetical protein
MFRKICRQHLLWAAILFEQSGERTKGRKTQEMRKEHEAEALT